jgi:hypothetical protein
VLQTTWLWTLLAEPRAFGVPRTKSFLPGWYDLRQPLFPPRRISLPARPADARQSRLIRSKVLLQTTWMWTLLAEPRPFRVPGTKLFLLGSYGLRQPLFPPRRISLPAHPVDAPQWRLVRPNVLPRS